jgi:hypothetical protein
MKTEPVRKKQSATIRELTRLAQARLVQERDQIKQELRQLKTLLVRFSQEDGISLVGHHNDNGADWYSCPNCGRSHATDGYAADHTSDLTLVEHDPSCTLVELRALVESWDD